MSAEPISIDNTNLVPAFGRHYSTAKEVILGFTTGHPFRIRNCRHPLNDTVIAISDLAVNESVFLMYHHNEKKAVFTLMDKG